MLYHVLQTAQRTDKDDIQGVIDRKIQEDREIEFKKTLATRDGTEDRWITQGIEIGNAAKRDIAKELIAFASTEGGTLILGIADEGEGARTHTVYCQSVETSRIG